MLDRRRRHAQDHGMASASDTPLFTGRPARVRRADGRGPGRPSRAQSEARDRELLDRALDLFLERGFDGTTIEAIVDSVGMARRTVYARYGDKITLFKAALQRAIDDWVVPPDELAAAETDDLEATLLAVARLMLAHVRSPLGLKLTRIAGAEVFERPEVAAYLWERTAKVSLGFLADLFGRRLSPEAADDLALAFVLLVVEGSSQAKLWRDGPEVEFDRQVRFRVRLFLDGARVMGRGAPR
jgi:AcrR family transcriptional regulator